VNPDKIYIHVSSTILACSETLNTIRYTLHTPRPQSRCHTELLSVVGCDLSPHSTDLAGLVEFSSHDAASSCSSPSHCYPPVQPTSSHIIYYYTTNTLVGSLSEKRTTGCFISKSSILCMSTFTTIFISESQWLQINASRALSVGCHFCAI